MNEDQLSKLVTATIAAPMIHSAIAASWIAVELGGDGKLPEAMTNKIVELAGEYAKKILESE